MFLMNFMNETCTIYKLHMPRRIRIDESNLRASCNIVYTYIPINKTKYGLKIFPVESNVSK